MKQLWKYLTENPGAIRKFIVALIGALAVAGSEGLLPEKVGQWVTVAVAFTTALGVYGVYNANPHLNSVSENI